MNNNFMYHIKQSVYIIIHTCSSVNVNIFSIRTPGVHNNNCVVSYSASIHEHCCRNHVAMCVRLHCIKVVHHEPYYTYVCIYKERSVTQVNMSICLQL